jgi:hypothetical protein
MDADGAGHQLKSPREKFWGAVLAFDRAGVCYPRKNLRWSRFDDFSRQIRAGDKRRSGGGFLSY